MPAPVGTPRDGGRGRRVRPTSRGPRLFGPVGAGPFHVPLGPDTWIRGQGRVATGPVQVGVGPHRDVGVRGRHHLARGPGHQHPGRRQSLAGSVGATIGHHRSDVEGPSDRGARSRLECGGTRSIRNRHHRARSSHGRLHPRVVGLLVRGPGVAFGRLLPGARVVRQPQAVRWSSSEVVERHVVRSRPRAHREMVRRLESGRSSRRSGAKDGGGHGRPTAGRDPGARGVLPIVRAGAQRGRSHRW